MKRREHINGRNTGSKFSVMLKGSSLNSCLLNFLGERIEENDLAVSWDGRELAENLTYPICLAVYLEDFFFSWNPTQRPLILHRSGKLWHV